MPRPANDEEQRESYQHRIGRIEVELDSGDVTLVGGAALLRRLADAEAGSGREAALDAVHDAFYRGDVAARLAAFVSEQGGFLEAADFADFRADVGDAPVRAFGRGTSM
jgi:gamma-glutamyltranspeptidase/glutathione hydrolase